MREHLGAPEVILAEALRERSFGDLEGTPVANYARVWTADGADGDHGRDGVEPAAAVLDRTTALVADLERRYSGRDILLVSHGDTLQILQAGFLRMDPAKHRSVPHLDTRVVAGETSLMFGPYAGFSTNFLKHGSLLDLFRSLRWHNLPVMIGVALKEFSLVRYLIGEAFATRAKQDRALLDFAPHVDPSKFYKITAGQRVQIMKRGADGKATLNMGTEVVAAADGSIAGLLGASPGASTALPIMLDLLAKCFPGRLADWEPELRRMVPSYGTRLNGDAARVASTEATTGKALQLL